MGTAVQSAILESQQHSAGALAGLPAAERGVGKSRREEFSESIGMTPTWDGQMPLKMQILLLLTPLSI